METKADVFGPGSNYKRRFVADHDQLVETVKSLKQIGDPPPGDRFPHQPRIESRDGTVSLEKVIRNRAQRERPGEGHNKSVTPRTDTYEDEVFELVVRGKRVTVGMGSLIKGDEHDKGSDPLSDQLGRKLSGKIAFRHAGMENLGQIPKRCSGILPELPVPFHFVRQQRIAEPGELPAKRSGVRLNPASEH